MEKTIKLKGNEDTINDILNGITMYNDDVDYEEIE